MTKEWWDILDRMTGEYVGYYFNQRPNEKYMKKAGIVAYNPETKEVIY